MTGVIPEVSRNPYLRANSLIDLLSWDDIDFVRCAYVTVLGRQPDTEGEAFYTYRLRQGLPKLQLLWQLRKSPEGPGHDPGIAGFDRALRKARWERSWLGWLIRPFTGGEADGPVWRRHRMIVNEIGRRNDAGSFGSSPELVAVLQQLTAQFGGLTKAVARLSAGTAAVTEPVPTHVLLWEIPDYRHLSAKGRNIFRELYAYSH